MNRHINLVFEYIIKMFIELIDNILRELLIIANIGCGISD